MYFYHLSGLGIEAWDHTEPSEDSFHPLRPCARSVARMACFTLFPKASNFASNGGEVSYVRPCRSSCENYVKACNVECCDEGVTCVWGINPDVNAEKRTLGVDGQTVLLET